LLPETVRKRCRHVVTENQRTLEMVETLKIGDLSHAGKLMNQSHQSLRDDYEVSCRELDLLAEAAQSHSAAFGGRMMGGGFGGCTVNLVMAEGVEAFRREVSGFYRSQTGREAESYVFEASPGGKFFSEDKS
jgi:galactokinase